MTSLISCNIVGVTAALKNIAVMGTYATAAADRGAHAAAEQLQEKEKQFAESSRWTGHLIESITIRHAGIGEYEVGPTVEYAPYVEYGTSPHWVSETKLTAWARYHSMEPKALRNKIGEEGTEAEPFVAPAIEAVKSGGAGFILAHSLMIRPPL
jgi:hypothetical protein